MSKELLSTILELARLGAVGIGAIVLMLAFLLLFRRDPIDPERGKLINRYMTLGFIFGLAAGALGLLPIFAKPSGSTALRVAFSPDMSNAGLSAPVTLLPDGKAVPAEEAFSLPASILPQVLTVKVDKTIDEVKNLRQAKQELTQATEKLAVSAAEATEQVKTLSAKAAEMTTAPAADVVQETAVETQRPNEEVLKSVRSGDFARVNSLSTRLKASVIKTNPAVATIARQP